MGPSPPTLERACGSLALLIMLILLVLTLHAPMNALPFVIIVATPSPAAAPPADHVR